MSDKKVITVLLTRYYSAFSNFIYYTSGRGYTHASIALDEMGEYFYSFNMKGFRKEYPKKHKRRSAKSVCYKLEVTAEDYDAICQRIRQIEEEKDKFHYSRVGVLCCLLHIPFKRNYYYFCSQFVADLLQQCKTVSMHKDTALYLPNHLPGELAQQSCLKEIVYNAI